MCYRDTLILTIVVEKTLPRRFPDVLLSKVFQNRINYSRIHNYETALNINEFNDKCSTHIGESLHLVEPMAWSKVLLFYECLKNFRRVVWIDADAVILAESRSIDSILSDSNCPQYQRGFAVAAEDCNRPPQFNTGFWLVDNSTASRDILRQIIHSSRDPKVRYHQHWENHGAVTVHRRNSSVKSLVCKLDKSLFWFPTTKSLSKGDYACQVKTKNMFLAHWAGNYNSTDMLYVLNIYEQLKGKTV